MMGTFRLLKATLGVTAATHVGMAIPQGEIIEIPIAAPAGNRMVDVLWKGQPMMMFVQDLRERSEEVKYAR